MDTAMCAPYSLVRPPGKLSALPSAGQSNFRAVLVPCPVQSASIRLLVLTLPTLPKDAPPAQAVTIALASTVRVTTHARAAAIDVGLVVVFGVVRAVSGRVALARGARAAVAIDVAVAGLAWPALVGTRATAIDPGF